MALSDYVQISAPPVISQDAYGNWTVVFTYSDGYTFTYFSGLNQPDILSAVQAAFIDLATNYNQHQLFIDSVTYAI